MKSKRNLLLSLLLCCVMLLGLLPATAFAATADETPLPFSFKVDKTVTKRGDVTPGEETFTFELVYGTVEQNNQYMYEFTPDKGVTLADCGIAFTKNTITTNGEGKETFTLGGTIDPTKVTAENHWQSSSGNDSVPKWIITLRLTEKNDGKAGWTYSDVELYLTITVIGNEISTDVHILGDDVSDNNFENIYTAYSFTVKKTDANGKALAGATFSLTGTGDFSGQNFEAVSGNDGIATFNVPEGNYTLSEKKAPNGYVKSNETYTLAVRDGDNPEFWGGEPGVYFYDEDEPDYSNYKYLRYEQVTFVNRVKRTTTSSQPVEVESAKTADAGIALYAGLAILSMTGSAGVVLRRRKNDK